VPEPSDKPSTMPVTVTSRLTSDGFEESEKSETTTINTKVPQFNGAKGDKYMLWKMKFEAEGLWGEHSFPISKVNFLTVRQRILT
jgi:hypothetical protein